MLRNVLGAVLVALFVGLGLVHVYWALGGHAGRGAAVPSLNGQPLFRPSRGGTLFVAAGLFVAALVVSGAAGWLGGAVPQKIFRPLTVALSLVFLLRAVGDGKHVGFFQRGSESAFAYWDLRLFSPLCLFIAAAALVLAFGTNRDPTP